MKLRIKGNTLRLRLSQSEVNLVAQQGYVEDAINFLDGKLVYGLDGNSEAAVSAEFSSNKIVVHIPQDKLAAWATSDEVGISGEVTLKDSDCLSILIEKDFQCLATRVGEDEGDLYKNPLAGSGQ